MVAAVDRASEVVDQALPEVYELLKTFATREDFLDQVAIAFGNNFDPEALEVLRQQWGSGDFEDFPEIEVRSAPELNGANGVFASATNTIYLSRDYLERNGANLLAVTNVLMEEYGHFVDARINEVDAVGDEGAIFSVLLHGGTLQETQIQELKAEDDTAILMIDSQPIKVEQQLTTHPQPPLQPDAYQLLRYELISRVEGIRLPAYLVARDNNPTTPANPTIGIGFDLRDAGSRDRVFTAFGINPNENIVDPTDAERRTYRQQLIDIINRHWVNGQNDALREALNGVMARRAARLTELNISVTHMTFAFRNQQEVRDVFDQHILEYERRANVGIINPPPYSWERAVAVSLSYVGDYEPEIKAAINNEDRAEAWYEIRYQRDNNDYRRHNIEAKIFSLYNPSNSDSVIDRAQREANALQIFRMLNKHESDISNDNARISGALVSANNNLGIIANNSHQVFGTYDVTDLEIDSRRHLRSEFEPAKTVLVESFATPPDEARAELRAAQFLATDSSSTLPRPDEIDGVFVAYDGAGVAGEVAAHTVDRTTREANNNLIYGGRNEVDSIDKQTYQVQNDLIFGGIDVGSTSGGDDTLRGGRGDDLFISGLGNDNHDGGNGSDTVIYLRSPSAVTVNLQTNSGQGGFAQGDTYTSIENVIGSAYGDTLTGNAQANILIGLDGNDLIEGGEGGDIILGGSGRDTLNGELGNDVLVGGEGNDTLDGGEGRDVAVFLGPFSNYDIRTSDNLTFTVKPKLTAMLDGEDTLKNIETLQFSDALVSLPDLTIQLLQDDLEVATLSNGFRNVMQFLQQAFNREVLQGVGLLNRTATSSTIGIGKALALGATPTASDAGIPFFGDLLVQTPAGHFIRDFGDEVINKFSSQFTSQFASAPKVQQALFDLFNSAGILKDNDGDEVITPSDIEFVRDGSKQQFNFQLGGKKTFSTNLPSQIGLSQLGLSLDQGAQAGVDLDYTFNVGFGLDTKTSQFFFDTSPQKDISVSFTPTLPTAKATIGFLQVDAKDIGSQLNFSVNLDDGNDHKLTVDELNNLIFDPEGAADIKLNLLSSVEGSTQLPRVGTDLNLHWDFINNGPKPEFSFDNTKLYLGSFLSGFAGGVLKQIQDVTRPLQPFTDALVDPIPLLTNDFPNGLGPFSKKLLDKDNNSIVNVVDFIKFKYPDLDTSYVDAIAKIIDLSNNIPTDGNDIVIDLNDFNFGDWDIRGDAPLQAAVPQATGPVETLLDQAQNGELPKQSAEFIKNINALPGQLKMPFLTDPATVPNLFLQKPIELFGYQLPSLNFELSNYKFATVPIFPPVLNLDFTGGLEGGFNMAFGYDTTGLSAYKDSGFKDPATIFNGFYVSDTGNVDGTGRDIPEASLSATIGGQAVADIGVGSLSGGGKLGATIGVDLRDVTPDGKIYIPEIETLIGQNHNFANLFDLKGELYSQLTASARLGLPPIHTPFGDLDLNTTKRFDSPKFTIASFDLNKNPNPPEKPQPLAILTNGVLQLSIGPDASKRQIDNRTDGDEAFTLTHSSGSATNETILISAFDTTQLAEGVRRITGNSGAGNDIIKLDRNILAAAELNGAIGDDQLTAGKGNDTLFGGEGDDVLIGGPGRDTLDGGNGLDVASYESALQPITLNLETGVFTGDAEGDTLKSIEQIDGSNYNDLLIGNAQANNFSGLSGNDTLRGGAGNDRLDGDFGDDSLFGEAGNDVLIGGPGKDTLDGGEGSDLASYADSEAGVVADLSRHFASNGVVSLKYTLRSQTEISVAIPFRVRTDNENLTDLIRGFSVSIDAFQFSYDELQTKKLSAASKELLIEKAKQQLSAPGQIPSERLVIDPNDIELTQELQGIQLEGDKTVIDVAQLSDPELQTGQLSAATLEIVKKQLKLDQENVQPENIRIDAVSIDLDSVNGVENVAGSQFADRLQGDAGDNLFYGNNGNDFLAGGLGSDVLDGGLGNDTASFADSDAGVFANLNNQTASTGKVSIRYTTFGRDLVEARIKFRTGPTVNDHPYSVNLLSISDQEIADQRLSKKTIATIIGIPEDQFTIDYGSDVSLPANTFEGIKHQEKTTSIPVPQLSARELVDRQLSEQTLATLRQQLALESQISPNLVRIDSTSLQRTSLPDIENLVGSIHTDTLTGNSVANQLTGGNGDDTLIGLLGSDTLDGGEGNDTVDYSVSAETLEGAASLSINLSTGLIQKFASDGRVLETDTSIRVENASGSSVSDYMIGSEKNNKLTGNTGDDTLEGGLGSDTLTGGAGRDLFVLAPNYGTDTITDFNIGEDQIQLTGGLTLEQLNMTQGSGAYANDTLIHIKSTNELLSILQNVKAIDLSTTDFVVPLEITLDSNTPPISPELTTYIPAVKGTDPLIGFNGTNIGEGSGDGINELVPFSFTFPIFKSIQSARLTLDLTAGEELIGTDELLFADNSSMRGVKFYGNALLSKIPSGTHQTVTFDLLNIDTNTGTEDLKNLLLDGDLNVVYADDAIIHSAHLEVTGSYQNESDFDLDGVNNLVENAAPNNGDGNQDSILDNIQLNVTSLPSVITGSYVTLVAPDGIALTNVQATNNPSSGNAPANVEFPIGFLPFQIHNLAAGSSTTINLILDPGVTVNTYYKFGPTPDNPMDHWYEFLFDGTTGAEINGSQITLHFVDGQRGDGDLAANGSITDPGAPAIIVNQPPIANDDLVTANQSNPKLILASALLANDTDPDGDPLTITAVTNPSNGTVKLDVDGNILFTSNPNFSGNASFDYTLSDDRGGTDNGKVTIAVGLTRDGTNRSDTLNGTPGDDNLRGLKGNDLLKGYGGHDILDGGKGNDTLYGGEDNDQLTGGSGHDQFIFYFGDGIDTITDFSGIGKGTNPSQSILSEADILQFNGEDLTAQNMLLNQNGSNLEISFAGVSNTKVILQNFQLENLENLRKSTGAAVDFANILFDSQTSPEDSFDVFDAGSVQHAIWNRNTVTFLNDLNNRVRGLDNSNDVINGQGGNDIINGLSGDDLLRGGSGNDILYGGMGADILVGGVGNDTLYLGIDCQVDTIIYSSGDGSDTINEFTRGAGSDLLRFEDIPAIDVVVDGSSTWFRLSDGIGGNPGFGSGNLLLKLNGTAGFTADNLGLNIAMGNTTQFLFS